MSVASLPRIAVLPSEVADQIAAGEVVERPSSVVKELVENALDAGATAIDVAVEDGGRQLIRVSDDGCGMLPDDALLSLERHATSKIRLAQDLVGVRSFGFRGEALAAICSVAQLELETAPHDGAGTYVRAAGGAVIENAAVARRRGTTVRVARLFYNAPARLKFLRGARAEWRAIVDVIGSMALTRRDVRVSLTHDGKSALVLPATSSLRERLAAVYGASFASRLLDVDDVSGTTHVAGLVERPADVGTTTRRVFVSVNGRAVRDAGLVRAAEAAYKSTIPAGVRPT
ncbi:MAG TPA: DNA mismatch repair endonuclease MutL, partial [Gemmatimonadaceae bacterium]|nr:DNA mismatch repair endonuclease MutL [Gemmatimonadaceae bacterium]